MSIYQVNGGVADSLGSDPIRVPGMRSLNNSELIDNVPINHNGRLNTYDFWFDPCLTCVELSCELCKLADIYHYDD